MTWNAILQLSVSAAGVLVALMGFVMLVRAATRTAAGGDATLKEKVDSLEKRVGTMEGDVRDLRKGMTDMLVGLAKIPEQLHSIESKMSMQHEAVRHSQGNLRSSIEALARRAGMLTTPDA